MSLGRSQTSLDLPEPPRLSPNFPTGDFPRLPRKFLGQPRFDQPHSLGRVLGCRKWGCNKWGFKGCLAALPGNRPESAFFARFLPFSPFSGGCEAPGKSREQRKKAFSLRYPQICLNPHLLNPHLRHSKG